MTRVKLDTPAFADQSVDTRTIKDGTIIAQDVSGSITNAKLANSSITIDGTAVSLGGSGTFNPLVEWQAVTVADGSTTLTAEAGKGYFLDTNTGVIEVFLPTSPSRGDTIILVDYSGTFALNKLIINTGGKLIDSTAGPDFKVTTNNSIVELVYIDANKGWQVILNQAAGTTPDNALDTGGGYDSATFIEATGGTVSTSGNFKIHSFTGDGNFVVASVGNPAGGGSTVDYAVVAGGGGGQTGGGGAGGFRESSGAASGCYTASPLGACVAGISVTATTFPITVGAGGSSATAGSNSSFSTITSAGGGGGGNFCGSQPGGNGGSGGGGGGGPNPGSGAAPGGTGNTPPVSPAQGKNGGSGYHTCGSHFSGGGGGGATAVGASKPSGPQSQTPFGNGGAGATTNITGSPVAYAGGGGAANVYSTAGTGGTGGGGNGNGNNAGTANTGGGGGGTGAGGKGIVLIRYKFQ